MNPKFYRPNPVLLPVEIANIPIIQSKLIDYMREIQIVHSKTQSLQDKNMKHIDIGDSQVPIKEHSGHLISREIKLALLQHPIPLYHDVFLVNNKILATGSHFPGLDELIGKPLLFIRCKGAAEKLPVQYFKENITQRGRNRGMADLYSPRYLVIEHLPIELLQNPTEWELIFQFNDFECCISLQENPFANAPSKTTLNTLQKDNPTEWISKWCNYYFHRHGVERIMIYNNGPLNPKLLPDLFVNENIEIWYVEWSYAYQHFFARCQSGALTHAYWWIGSAANYFLNFDIDEYLVNESGIPLVNYMQKTNASGLKVVGYGVPEEIIPPRHEQEIFYLRDPRRMQNSGFKYIYRENHWYHLDIHNALRFSFYPKPRFWILLEKSSTSMLFTASKYLYRISCGLFRWQSLFLIMPKAPPHEMYFLHYRSCKTIWKDKPYLYSHSN